MRGEPCDICGRPLGICSTWDGEASVCDGCVFPLCGSIGVGGGEGMPGAYIGLLRQRRILIALVKELREKAEEAETQILVMAE